VGWVGNSESESRRSPRGHELHVLYTTDIVKPGARISFGGTLRLIFGVSDLACDDFRIKWVRKVRYILII